MRVIVKYRNQVYIGDLVLIYDGMVTVRLDGADTFELFRASAIIWAGTPGKEPVGILD